MSDKIDNLTLDSNKRNHPGIIPPENPVYYLDAAEYNELIDTVSDLISRFNQIQAGGGNLNNIPIIVSGSNEQPTNKNLFSALKTIEEINKNSGLDSNLYLKRTENDTAEGEIKFENNTYYGDFLQGISGGKIDKHANAELKSLKLREWLEVPELRFNRTSITIGDEIRGPGGGIIEWVDPTTRTLRLKLEDGEYGALEENDLCMGIIHSINPANNSNTTSDDGRNNRTIQGFATVYFKITQQLNPGENNSDFKYELRPGTTIHPEKFLNFGVFGNTLNTHRQYSVYQTRTYTRFLIGMNTWECNFNNIAMQFGDLSNLNTFDQPIGFTGYSIYLNNVYLSGQIQTIKAPYIGEDGYWYYWDFEKQQYVKTDSKGESIVINPIKYSLIPKAHAIERLTADTFNPDSIACGLQKATTDLNGETIYESLDFVPNGFSLEIRTNETGILMPYVPDQTIMITPEMKSIEFHLRKGNTLLDKQFIPVRESSGLTLQVNPQTILCEVDSEGNVLNWSGTKVITCELIQGLNEQLTPILSVSFPQSVSYTISGNQVIISNISKINGVSMTGIITATAMFNGASVSRTATIQFTTTGKGENAIIHSIHPDPERVKIFKDGTYEINYAECYIVRYDGRFEERLQAIPNDYIVKYNFRYNNGDESEPEEYTGPVYIPSEVSRITYKLYKRTNTSLHISEASTLIVPVGNDGSDGWSNAQVRLEMRSATQPQVPQNPITYNLRSAKITAGNLGNWVHGVAPFEKNPRWVTYALASSKTETDVIQPNEWSAPIEDSTNLISREIYLYKRAPVDSPPSLPTTTLIYNFDTMVLSGNLEGWSQTPKYVQGLAQWRTHAMAVTSGMTDDIEPSEWVTPPYIHAQDGQDGEGSVVIDATSETLTLIVNGSREIIAGNEQTVTYGMLFGNEDIEVTQITPVVSNSGVNISHTTSGSKKSIKFTFANPISQNWYNSGVIKYDLNIKGIKDGTEITRVRTITFIIQKEAIGASGKDATIYSLHTTEDALMLDKNNNWIGANSFDVKVKRTTGDITTILNDFPSGYTVTVQIDNSAPYSYNNYPISPNKTANRVRLELKKGQTLIDTETIPIIRQGKDGSNGTNGVDGLGSWTVILTNEFSVVKVSDSNNVISGYPINTKVKLYHGTDLYTMSNLTIPIGGSSEVIEGTASSATGVINITKIKDGSASNKEVIEIPITITAIKDGQTHVLEKTLTVVKLRDGEQGPPGISVPLVFRGEWVLGDTHFGTENRRDLVKVTTQSTASYYMTNTSLPVKGLIASNSNKPRTSGGNNYWIPFDGSYQSIATGLLLAEKANIGGFAFSGQTKASKVPANSIISQFGVDWNSKANVDLTKEQSIIDQFLPNLTLNGEFGYIQMRDSVLLNSDGSGYVANNNFKWDQLGNIHIGPLKAGRYYESALDVTGKQMWVEFSKEGYSYWHFPHTSADRFIRVKTQGGHWSEPQLYRPGREGSAPNRRVYAHDMDKVHYKYQFATTASALPAISQDETGVTWSDNIPTVATNRFLWFKRQIYNPSTQSYDNFERPCRITPEGGHKAKFLHPIHFNAEDGSGWMANGNLNWDSNGNLNLNDASLQNADVVGHIEASSGKIGTFKIGNNYIGAEQSTNNGIPGTASSGFSLYNDFLKFSENKTMTSSESGYNKSVFLGINTFSVLSGSTAMARFESKLIPTSYSSSFGNIGIYFKMSGAPTYDSNPGYGNHALYIQEGTVVGLRPRLRRVSGSWVNISRLDTTLVVTNKNTDLWVPSGDEALDAQLYYIWPSGYKEVNIRSSKSNIYSILNKSGTNNHNISDFKWHLLIYDKNNDRWLLGWGTGT